MTLARWSIGLLPEPAIGDRSTFWILGLASKGGIYGVIGVGASVFLRYALILPGTIGLVILRFIFTLVPSLMFYRLLYFLWKKKL